MLFQIIPQTEFKVSRSFIKMLSPKTILIGLVSLVVLGFWLWKRRHLYRYSWNTPGDWGLPLLGSLPYIRTFGNFAYFAERMLKKYKTNAASFWFGLDAAYVTINPVDLQTILNSSELLNKSRIYRAQYFVFKGGLISSPGGYIN